MVISVGIKRTIIVANFGCLSKWTEKITGKISLFLVRIKDEQSSIRVMYRPMLIM